MNIHLFYQIKNIPNTNNWILQKRILLFFWKTIFIGTSIDSCYAALYTLKKQNK